MTAPTEIIRAWVNAPAAGLAGAGGPLPLGCYLSQQASPAEGCYAVAGGDTPQGRPPVAESDGRLVLARVSFAVYGEPEPLAEKAAQALAAAIDGLTGRPVPVDCGGATARLLVSDALAWPAYVPPGQSGEQFCFTVAADFLIEQ